MSLCSEKMNHIGSDIRGKNFFVSLEMEKRGEKVLKLNTGNPATFGFGMPDSVRQALIENMDKAVGYCDVRCMVPAREAIYNYQRTKNFYNFTMDNIFVGNGVSEIASMLTTALINPGDEVLVPTPCYSLWTNEVILHSGKPVFYKCDEANGWNPDTEHIKSLITPKTKAILVINPNNPTGVLYSEDTLKEIVEIARQNNLIILSDEIYDRLVFDGKKHVSTASLAEDLIVITMNGLSKSHCLCGFRCGWLVVSGPEKERTEICDALMKIASIRLSANALMQTIIPAALDDFDYTNAMIAPGGRLYEQRKATCEELDKIEAISYVKNDASFYIFPKIDPEMLPIENDKEFAHELLLDKHILIVPGSGFMWDTTDHFRIVMLPEPEELATAVREMGDFISKKIAQR